MIKGNPFLFKQILLLFISVPAWQRNFSFSIDDAVPGKIVLAGAGMENSGNLAGASTVVGMGCNNAVGADFTGWNGSNNCNDFGSKW